MYEAIKKYATIPRLRRVFQFSIIFLMLFGPLTEIIRTFRQDPPSYTESPVYGNFVLNSILGAVDHSLRNFLKIFYDDISGGPYALKIYFLHLAEPLTSFIYTTANLFHPSSWDVYMIFSFALPLMIAFFFGRIYCGYICPMSAIVSTNIKLQKKFFNREITQTSASPSKQPVIRVYFFYTILGISLIQPMLLQYFLPPSAMQHASADYILFGGFTSWMLIVFALLLFEAYKPAYFCRNLCPTGLFLNHLGEKRILQIDYISGSKCLQDCSLCNDECWLGLNPKGHADDPACDLCHRCVEACPQNRLNVGFRKKFIKRFHKRTVPIACFFLFTAISNTKTLNAEGDTGYINSAFFSTLMEGRAKGKSNISSDEVNIYYSVVASKQLKEGETAYLHVHIQQTKDTFFSGPITLEISSGGKSIVKENLETVNFPVSIRKPSIYRIPFPFERYRKYDVKIVSQTDAFNAFLIKFSSPMNRF